MSAFVVVRDSTFAWRFVTVALKRRQLNSQRQMKRTVRVQKRDSTRYLLQVSVQLLDVVLLIEHRGHIVVFQLVVRRFARYVITVAQIERKIDHALLTIEIFLLSQHDRSSIAAIELGSSASTASRR